MIPVEDVRSVAFVFVRKGATLSQARSVMTLRSGEAIAGNGFEAWSDTRKYADIKIIIPDLNEHISLTRRMVVNDAKQREEAIREIAFTSGATPR
jgi:hypothetical protein